MQQDDEGDLPFAGGAPALDALRAMRSSEARLARLESQLEAVEGAVAALRDLIAEETLVRRRLMDEHRDQLEAEARSEHAALLARQEAVRADYDRLASGLDEQLHRHAEKALDAPAFAAAQRASSDALRASAAELARLDQLRALFEETLGVSSPAAPAATTPHVAAAAPPRTSAPPPSPVAAAPQPQALPPPLPLAALPFEQPPTSPTPLPAMSPVPLADVPFPPPLPTPLPLADPRQAAMPPAVLVEAHEAGSGASHAVHDGLQIGRAIDNELRVLDPSVSRQHATIVVRAGAFVLEDLRSQNGTFVNGERIRQRVLCDGDRIGIGEAAFVFRVEPSDEIEPVGQPGLQP
jgi:FHA domain